MSNNNTQAIPQTLTTTDSTTYTLPSSGPYVLGPVNTSGTIYTSNANFIFPHTFERHTSGSNAICSACNKEKEIVYEYGSKSITRHLCEFCYIAGLDNKFNIKSTSETLETLFKKD